MRKVVLCLFYALCAFTIAFSLFWMALPRLPLSHSDPGEETPADTQPSLAAQALPDTGTPRQYLLCDEGGMVAVYTCGPDGSPALRVEQTEIYVNLLPCASSRAFPSPAKPPSASFWRTWGDKNTDDRLPGGRLYWFGISAASSCLTHPSPLLPAEPDTPCSIPHT